MTALLGPRGRGPSLRAFLLLAALQVVGAVFRVIDGLPDEVLHCAQHPALMLQAEAAM